MIGQALLSVAVLLAWFVGPACVAAVFVDRMDVVRRDRAAVARSRAARQGRR